MFDQLPDCLLSCMPLINKPNVGFVPPRRSKAIPKLHHVPGRSATPPLRCRVSLLAHARFLHYGSPYVVDAGRVDQENALRRQEKQERDEHDTRIAKQGDACGADTTIAGTIQRLAPTTNRGVRRGFGTNDSVSGVNRALLRADPARANMPYPPLPPGGFSWPRDTPAGSPSNPWRTPCCL